MERKSSWLRKLSVLMMVFAIVFTYSVIPMNQSFAASAKKPKKITVKADTKVVDIKGKATIKVTKVTPKGASTAVKYKSSKKKIATVNSKGVVTGKKKGTVKITVTSKKNKKAKKVIKIKVKDLKPSKITLSATSAKLEPGKTLALAATAAPTGVYAPMAWTSSNNAVATVSASGVVTAKAAGTATITVATTKAAGKIVKATCSVTVADPENTVEKDATVGAANTKTLTTSVDMSKYPAEQVVKVWVPVPQTDEYQTITNVDFSADKATKAEITTEKANGNKMLYVEWGKDVDPNDRKATLTFTAKRYEVSRDPASIVEDPKATIPADVKAYINKESEYVKVNDPVVKDTAAKITEGKTGTLEKAEAIYTWVFNNLERIDDGEELTGPKGTKKFVVDGCGYGDTVQILKDLEEVGRAGGHCTDINSTFVALCRASGIPAREMFGIRINSPEGGQHCWAEFYVAGTGWVYADPGDALKFGVKTGKNMSYEAVAAARESADGQKYFKEYWCGVDNNRVLLSRGRDITFEPAQAWGVCNTFGYPAAEVDGKRLETSFADYNNFEYHYTSAEDRTIFVDTAYVKDAIDKKSANTVIAEVSWGATLEDGIPEEYIPTAIHVNTDSLESNGQDGDVELWDLRDAENNYKKLMDALAGYGITKDTELICYGWGENNSGVTRLAMAALMMGVKDVKVLEGGTKAWFDAGYDKVPYPAADPKPAESFGLDAPAHPEWVVDSDDVVANMDKEDGYKLVSIRSYDEFIGQNSGYAYIDKAGEPKGAIWGHDTDDGSYFENGKFVGIDKINEFLAPYGASTSDSLAFYCGTGWRATIPFLICYEAGIDNMKLFDDGWYVYSGAFKDAWNWPGKTEPTKAVHPEYPVQLGDPAKGDVTYTTVGELEAKYNPLRGDITAKADTVKLVPGVASALGFNIMPAAKAGITNSVTFTSSDENVATVDAEGKVTIKADAAAGSEATITATGNATFGSTPDKAGTHKTASYKVTTGKYVELGADDWASLGIKYEAITEDDYLIDVRTKEMFNAGHLAGSVNSPVSNGYTEDQKTAIKAEYDKAAGKRVVIVCVSGNMLAKNAFDALKASGADMSNVTFLIGGANGAKDHWVVVDFNNMTDAAEWAKYGTETIADADYVVDVREATAYDAGHIPGAVSAATTGSVIEAGSDAAKNLDKAFADAGDKRIVLICYGGMKYAKAAMTYLYAKDTSLTPDKVTYLIGGFNKWKTANPYCIGDMLVDPAAKTVEFKATVNSEYTESPAAISHFVLNKDTTDKSSPFVTSVKPLELHAALTALGALPWSDTARSFETGKTLNDVAGDNENFTHLDITVDGAPVASVLKYKKDGVEADPAGAIDMAFSGNKENQTAWNTGCVSCIMSCYAGIVSNAAVGIGTVNEEQNYFYLDTDKLAGGQEVTLVYTLK